MWPRPIRCSGVVIGWNQSPPLLATIRVVLIKLIILVIVTGFFTVSLCLFLPERECSAELGNWGSFCNKKKKKRKKAKQKGENLDKTAMLAIALLELHLMNK
jgi:hypothetical protein